MQYHFMAEGKFAMLYDLMFGLILRRMERKIVDIAFRHKCEKIVDMGCGTGLQLSLLNKNGFDTIGIDISPAMARYAKRKGLQCIIGDISSAPFPSHNFDCLIYSFVFHLNEEEKIKEILHEGKRILKRGGKIIITDYGRKGVITKMIERLAPEEHYSNYLDYIKKGAIDNMVQISKMKLMERHRFYKGAVQTIVLS